MTRPDKNDRITPFLDQAAQSLDAGNFLRLLLSRNEGAEPDLKKIAVRRVEIKGAEKLALTYHYKTRDIVKNYDLKDGLSILGGCLGDGFKAGVLFTTQFDFSYPSLTRAKPTQKDAANVAHDRSKHRHVATDGKAYLHALGLTDALGTVLKSAQDKYRQIDKYIEIAAGLIAQNPSHKITRIADMGAGKGYLTFALYDYLASKGADITVTGVEMRPDLVENGNKIAADNNFTGLTFAKGTIADYDCTSADMLIALHACDTATDDAIYKGIAAGAKIILTAPCCHKQVRRDLEKTDADKSADYGFLLRHGIFMERHAEMLTDSLRALYLEQAGYSVKVFEFISDSHTPKNVMIAAVKDPRMEFRREEILQKIMAAKKRFGLSRHHLETLLGLDL